VTRINSSLTRTYVRVRHLKSIVRGPPGSNPFIHRSGQQNTLSSFGVYRPAHRPHPVVVRLVDVRKRRELHPGLRGDRVTQKDAGARQSDERRPKKCAVTSTPPAVSRASLNSTRFRFGSVVASPLQQHSRERTGTARWCCFWCEQAVVPPDACLCRFKQQRVSVNPRYRSSRLVDRVAVFLRLGRFRHFRLSETRRRDGHPGCVFARLR
jgi:hypothetical protein